jgi:TolB-like protein/tetratricopeptide (TPR) repeat protein
LIGTIPYMAPEQLRATAADARSDLFALGIVLYELATGQRPFRGDSDVETGSAILRDTPASLSTLRPGMSPDLDRVLQRCLQKNPGDRYQAATDLLADLRRIGRGPAEQAPAAVPSIAVLPFVNTSRDEENDYFADGLSEELLNVLTRIRGLRVASRTSAFSFKGKAVDLATVARQLNVATILEGSVRQSGRRVRITADLIQASTDARLWSQTYDRELDDIFAVQDDIAQSVVQELRATLLGESPGCPPGASVQAEVEAAGRGRRANADAYRLTLQGRFFAGRFTDESISRGIALYRQALELDPGYALAWAGLSMAHASQIRQGFARPADALGPARDAAERALRAEPDLAEAHLALGLVRMDHDWDWAGAESSLRRAMDLAPGSADVVSVMAELMLTLGRADEAIRLSRSAVELDPLSVTAYKNLGRHLFYAGRLDEAEAAIRKMLEISLQGGLAHYLLGFVHLMQGRFDEALAEFEREPIRKFHMLGLTLVHHARGRTKDSGDALRRLIDGESTVGACQIAWAHAFRGEADQAFEWLERARVERDTPAWLSRHPLLRGLHADARWGPFLEKLGLTAAESKNLV